MYQDLEEAGGEHVFGSLSGTITNIGHQILALETPSNPVVNTLGFSPVVLNQKLIVGIKSV